MINILKINSLPNLSDLAHYSEAKPMSIQSSSCFDDRTSRSMCAPTFDHIALLVKDVDTSVDFYCNLFNGAKTWQMTGGFSDTTLRRLPHITKLVEVKADDVRWHIFDNGVKDAANPTQQACYQHVCIRVQSQDQLLKIKDRYDSMAHSNLYALGPQDFTGIITQGNRTEFYCKDNSGNEIEVIYDRV